MRNWIRSVVGGGCVVMGVALAGAQEPGKAVPVVDAPAADGKAMVPETAAGKMLSRVLKMFAGEKDAIGEDDLAEAFKAAVPIGKLRGVTGQIRTAEGTLELESIEQGATEKALVANVIGKTKGTPLRVLLNLDAEGKIEGLLIQPGVDKRVPELKSWEDLKERMNKAAEKTGIVIVETTAKRLADAPAENLGIAPGKENGSGGVFDSHLLVTGLHADAPLALGSAFKLWVLGALTEQVVQGQIRWDDPLRIEDALKSLPSGTMQDEKDGKEFPVRTFADKMISISDNTATDHLIHLVGRDACEKFMAAHCQEKDRNIPFLSTRDLFVLKLTPGNELPEKYLAADVAVRRKMIADSGEIATGKPQIMLAAAWSAPRYIDRLEWFASPSDMAATLAALDARSHLKGLEPLRATLSINPGLPIDKKVFPYVGFKGGSEPGVMSLNWLLERNDGRRFVVSMIFNDTKKAIDEGRAIALAGRLVEFLGKWDVKK